MKFVPYDQISSMPNIIVDGAATQNTVLTLSHWPRSGTPLELKRDTSAESAFAYLDAPRFHVQAAAVSNNHFDEDGLVGIFTLLEPSVAQRHRELLIDAAQAGDFACYTRRDAARIAFTLSAFADAESSPLPHHIFTLPYPDMASELYVELLKVLPRLLTNLNDYRKFWEHEDAALTTTEEFIEQGLITIEERPELDLAIVRISKTISGSRVHRFTQLRRADYHPLALHNNTRCSRLLLFNGHQVEFHYRYEGWVQMVSRRPAPRVDLSELVNELNAAETAEADWTFDGVDQITPKLRKRGGSATSLTPETILDRIEFHLRTGIPAWDPYDSGQ